jgi:hypothetical protein
MTGPAGLIEIDPVDLTLCPPGNLLIGNPEQNQQS